MAARILTAAVFIALGIVYGGIATIAHQARLAVASVALPAGLVVGLLGLACLLAGLRFANDGRGPALFTGVGVIAIVALFTLESFGGSILVPDNVPGMIWAVAPALLTALIVAWPRASALRRRPADANR